MNSDTDIRFLKGVGEKRALLLNKLGIDTFGALLRFYPRAYEDWRNILPIADCAYGSTVCVRAKIVTPIEERKVRTNMILYKFCVRDEWGGELWITLFNNKYLAERLHTDSTYLFYGKIGGAVFLPEMVSPQIAETGAAGIRPIYPATAGFTSKNIEKLMRTAIACGVGEDPLPQTLRQRNDLCELRFAIENIHFPTAESALSRAKRRLVFEELFILQTALLLLKGKNRALAGTTVRRDASSEFEALLPFVMTAAQKKAIADCIADMKSGRMMNRLIQGDVGCGKTAVAASLCYTAAQNGLQSALMAPTEILAEQHFKTLSAFFAGTEMQIVLLTGAMTKKQKESVKTKLADGTAMIAVGTHALLTEDVSFSNLGLVITDEQHRFGVAQRAKLAAKGRNPHTLVMSATPIPRTLGLILYGDLDISIIDEYPKGRLAVESYCVDSSYHARAYTYVAKHLDADRQGYIVCPLVEENEILPVKSAEELFRELQDGFFKNYRLGLLHGKMKAKEKDAVMRAFQNGEIQLLICTTVIEVGIDVPNAAIMILENAERFGLSQLHQLRGRIGRGEYRSTCIFITDGGGENTRKRMEIITKNSDGFKIADEDLALRGPGDFLGQRQHGLPELKIADLSDDLETLRIAGEEAKSVLETDPHLKAPENAGLRAEVIALYRKFNEN